VADIGCDHGFVSIYLMESGKAISCLAMDVNQGPLMRAQEHIREHQLSTYIETRLSDGAKAINFVPAQGETPQLEVDAAIIAGMGGRLMARIIRESLDKFCRMREIVLEPQSEVGEFRRFLRENDFQIVAEDMVLEDGKFYPVIKAVPGKAAGESDELTDWLGEILLREKHPVLLQYLNKEETLYREIENKLSEQDTVRSRQRRQEVEERLSLIHRGLEWFQQ
jgi:tRNA (adenine22-N1)-methyltransferase